MIRLILLALLPQFAGVLLMVGPHSATFPKIHGRGDWRPDRAEKLATRAQRQLERANEFAMAARDTA